MDRLDKINDEIQKDTSLVRDIDVLKEATLNIPYLHHKYLVKFQEQKGVVSLMESRKNQRYHDAMMYYSGKADPEIYREKPLDHTILKSDLETWIKIDKNYVHACHQLVHAEAVLDLYKRTVDRIPNHSFYIQNYIDMLKFENGER